MTSENGTTNWRTFVHRRSELIMPLILVVVAAVLGIGSLRMRVLGDTVPGPQFVPLMLAVLILAVAICLTIVVIRQPELPAHELSRLTKAEFSHDMLHDFAELSPAADSTMNTSSAARSRAPATDASPRSSTHSVNAARPSSETDAPSAQQPRFHSDWVTLLGVIAAVLGFIIILNPLGWILSAAALFWVVARLLGSRRPALDIGVALLVSSIVQLTFGGLLGLALPAGFIGGL